MCFPKGWSQAFNGFPSDDEPVLNRFPQHLVSQEIVCCALSYELADAREGVDDIEQRG
ncbi:MAG TPA: hypothetical protein PKD27_13035 [Tepidiformaceae bacterium]|nr:hypothetical protein [Tepidiformaceae bacterium]